MYLPLQVPDTRVSALKYIMNINRWHRLYQRQSLGCDSIQKSAKILPLEDIKWKVLLSLLFLTTVCESTKISEQKFF